jgi:hypothetical protein
VEVVFFIGLVALIAFNAYASRQCYRDAYSSRGQRWAQIAFIWVVPLIGAALALRLLQSEPERSSGTYSGEPNMGDEFAGSGKLDSQGYIASIGDRAHSVGDSDVSPD